jgi:hypothetical protein
MGEEARMGIRSPRGAGWPGAFDKARHVGQRPWFQTDRCLVLHVVLETRPKDRTAPPDSPRPGPESGPGARD